MNKIGALGLTVLGCTIIGGVVLRGAICGAELGRNIASKRRRKKLEKLSKDPKSNIIKIGDEYYEIQNSEDDKVE